MNTQSQSFSDARIQLHWSSQLLSGVADALLDAAHDDSHSNLDWDEAGNRLVGRTGWYISVTDFVLSNGEDSFSLNGQTLEGGKQWLESQVNKEIEFRDYDMPEHPITAGAKFGILKGHLESISAWYSFGKAILKGFGELRVWPHHFDLGFWKPSKSGPERSIGGGFSHGDNHFDMPYFYLNPYGVERPSELPPLSAGKWTDKWFGAVLIANQMEGSGRAETARDFATSAYAACEALIDE